MGVILRLIRQMNDALQLTSLVWCTTSNEIASSPT